MGLWRYKFKCNLLINFSILQRKVWYTLQKCLSFQYEPDRRLPFQSQQLEHVGNMFTVNNEDTEAMSLSSHLILNSFYTLFLCLSSQLWTGRFSCWDGWYHKQTLSKQNLFPHLIFQLLTFVLRYVSQQTFNRRFNVVFRLIWRGDVAQRQVNVETSTLKFAT